MKGIVFNVFNQLVEEKFGLEVWDTLLNQTSLPSQGIYTAGGNYDDNELFALVGKLSNISKISIGDLVKAYGEYLLGEFARLYPIFFKADMTAKEFLMSVDEVIHVEVRKLYPGASLPEFSYEDPGENELVIIYRSPKKLCTLAEGLINGTSIYFGSPIEHSQTKCMLNGDDHCRFEIHLKEQCHECS